MRFQLEAFQMPYLIPTITAVFCFRAVILGSTSIVWVIIWCLCRGIALLPMHRLSVMVVPAACITGSFRSPMLVPGIERIAVWLLRCDWQSCCT